MRSKTCSNLHKTAAAAAAAAAATSPRRPSLTGAAAAAAAAVENWFVHGIGRSTLTLDEFVVPLSPIRSSSYYLLSTWYSGGRQVRGGIFFANSNYDQTISGQGCWLAGWLGLQQDLWFYLCAGVLSVGICNKATESVAFSDNAEIQGDLFCVFYLFWHP